jgi:anti-anti-sigma factor
MAPIEPPLLTGLSRGLRSPQTAAVIWLAGEQDISTSTALIGAIADAIAMDDTDLVLDLSRVSFMGAATIEVLVRARDFLRARSRSLSLRAPSTGVARVLGLCGLADLVDARVAEIDHLAGPAGALGTWVAVPATERGDRAGSEPEAKPAAVPADLARVRAPR